MGQKIIVGPVNNGIKKDVTPFNIDNDSFLTLINAYQWRGRVKRKRGTSTLGRLNRQLTVSFALTASSFNLKTLFPEANGSIVAGSINLIGGTDGTTYTDPNKNAVLVATGGTGIGGSINYTTGILTITSGGTETMTGTFSYYPNLPVMGLEDLELIPTQFPGTIAFDTKYSYNVSTSDPYPITNVTFYKNPASGLYPGYIQKTALTSFTWNGKDYQQFWTTNDQGALFATNGITIPFNITNIGMQFKSIVSVTVTSGGPPAIVTLNINTHGLVVGDFLFINEVITTTGINFQTGYVIAVIDGNNVSVEFPNATIATNGTGGIAQYLTNTATATKDPIRFYDGNPITGNGLGWVNFSPPLSQALYSIAQLPLAQYYLAGARIIVDFKDRLLFLGPVVQNSTGGIFYLQDTIIYSQNGTPYYTASFTGAVDSSATIFTPILVPPNQTATAPAWFEDDTGFGGFISKGTQQPLVTCSNNEDVLLTGFSSGKSRVVYSGNDLIPFIFYDINSELGDASTFSTIDLDKGVITRGTRGYTITSQTQSQRFDLDIPDQVFQIDLSDNGNERFTSGRNFINEWIYFTYNSNNAAEGISNTAVFPNESLFYNYRDNSWAIMVESYTHYGQFRKQTGFIWETVGLTYPTWDSWNDPWNSGTSTLLQELLIAGNQQGFIIIRDEGTSEAKSLYIQSFSNGTNIITSPDHNLNNNDYIIISDTLGTVSTLVNGNVYQIFGATRNTFRLSPDPLITTQTYLGSGLITKIYIPFIQTKQFPAAWDMARKTRLGQQQYLFTTTDNAQITLQIYLSQNANNPYNNPPVVPNPDSVNDSLIYSQVLYTCPESANLGLTPANYNLNTPTAQQQAQTWHRMNTSLIGDTIQIGFTLSDAQVRDQIANNAFSEIELHGFCLDVSPSQYLA